MKHQKPAYWFPPHPAKSAGAFHRYTDPFKPSLGVRTPPVTSFKWHFFFFFPPPFKPPLLYVWASEGEWLYARTSKDASIFKRTRSDSTYRLADQHLQQEDLRATHTVGVRSGDCGVFFFFLLLLFSSPRLSLSVTWMLSAVSTCCRSCRTWRWQVEVEVERRWFPPAPPPPTTTTRRCPPARRRAPTTGAARTAPSWTPLGFSCRGSSPWWLSARWCVSVCYQSCCWFFFLFGSVSDIWLQLLGGTRSPSNRVPRLISCVIDPWRGWVTGKGKPLWYTCSPTFCRGF